MITDDVLSISKLEANKIELNIRPFRLKDIVTSVVTMFQSQLAEKKLFMMLKLMDDELIIEGDPDRLLQILINLISNAIKFTHSGGITVTSRIIKVDMDINLEVSITDTGIGMSAEEKTRIFDRFSQASHKTFQDYGGSGLGLSITKGLVELMEGSISVSTERWIGSTFTFNIKCKQSLSQDKTIIDFQSTTNNIITEKQTTRNILIVEDNPINQKVICRYLESMGHICKAANNGEEALNKVSRYQFDLIFMDIEMPVMNGLEATGIIRSREELTGSTRVPIIGLSGNARREHIDSAFKAGMDDYITKPYDKLTIHSKVYQWTGL